MKRWLLLAVVCVVLGCEDSQTVVVEPAEPHDPAPTIVNIYEDEIPDVIYIVEEDTTPDIVYITQEDTTPDVVQEFYSDAADLPVLLWNVGGSVPMPKKLRQLNGGVAITEIVADDAIGVDQDASGDSMFIEYKHFRLPTNHIGGLICSMDADTAHDVNIAAGACRDDADAVNMRLASEITKQIDANWAVGDDAGGLDTGAVAASTMYAIWLIRRSDTGVVDAVYSLSFAAPTLVAGDLPNYDEKRLVGAIRTDSGSDIWQFRQSGDYFTYLYDLGGSDNKPQDVNDSALTSNTFKTGTLSAPPHAICDIMARVGNAGGSSSSLNIFIRELPSGSMAAGNNNLMQTIQGAGITNVTASGGRCRVVADSSKQFEYAALEATGAATILVYTHGFEMTTRREPQ